MKRIHTMFIVIIFLLSSCATGSYIITGQKRDPIDPSLVKLYTTAPENYEVIGIVNASSDSGWTQQGDMDYAVSELKKQAATLGANGILLTGTGESTSSTVGSYSNGVAYSISSTAQTIAGQAIYVTKH